MSIEKNNETIICHSCKTTINLNDVADTLYTCSNCQTYLRIGPKERITYLIDPGTFVERNPEIRSLNPLGMNGYDEKLEAVEEKSRLNEAVMTGTGCINKNKAVFAFMSFQFFGGSMGAVVGEKITRAIEIGSKESLPVIIYATSGGARMQEGIFSLMQMAKTSAAVARLGAKGIPFFVVLSDPTSGGVTASFAMLGDVIMAEPDAFVGFAGPRVIEGTLREHLPKGFQRAEFQMAHGFVDKIVSREEQKEVLAFLINTHVVDSSLSKQRNNYESN